MTTAHRATWKAARGSLQEEGSFRLLVPSAAVSSKDAPTEPNLKRRATEEPSSREDLRARLETAEEPVFKRPRKSRFAYVEGAGEDETPGDILGLPAPEVVSELAKKDFVSTEDPTEDNDDAGGGPGAEERRLIVANADKEADQSASDDDESSDDDSDDDEAELLAELEQIRKEREFERAKKQAEEQEREEQEESARAAAGNPLLGNLGQFNDEFSDTASIATSSVPAFAVRRRWDDDLVFRNQARGEKRVEQRFVNDTTKNDFHRRFMKRHIR